MCENFGCAVAETSNAEEIYFNVTQWGCLAYFSLKLHDKRTPSQFSLQSR